eukprot:scaffold7522_cov202-Skeletonema_marinoi.AAC.33
MLDNESLLALTSNLGDGETSRETRSGKQDKVDMMRREWIDTYTFIIAALLMLYGYVNATENNLGILMGEPRNVQG